MSLRTFLAACAATTLLSLPALADGIMVMDAYARAASPAAKSGAAFMVLHNTGTSDDRLVGVRTDAAARVELHTHLDAGNGVVQMREIEGGIALPAGGMHVMERGGDHVMLMGLTGPLEQGGTVEVTLVFETAGEVVVSIPVDNDRAPEASAHSH